MRGLLLRIEKPITPRNFRTSSARQFECIVMRIIFDLQISRSVVVRWFGIWLPILRGWANLETDPRIGGNMFWCCGVVIRYGGL